MNINFLKWDSEFFNRKIGEVILTKNENLETEDFNLIVVKQSIKFDVKLNGYNLSFQESKINFTKKIDKIPTTNCNKIKDTDISEKTASFFKELAYESGKKSRFLLDEKFGEDKFKELYDIWVINSLNKKIALKTFYIEENNQAIGFVTLQKFGTLGKIGLLSIHPDFQGKGFGRKLLNHAEKFCFSNGILELEISTQQHNFQACTFYKMQGYEIKDEIIIKHYWKI